VPAVNNLGVCYAVGVGVTANAVEKVRWSRLAADQGLAAVQYSLGLCNDLGGGVNVTANAEEAARWYRLAADQELAAAQYSLGCAAKGLWGCSKR
jgi:TPR repeat protein